MEIGYFTPPAFTKRQFDINELNDSFGKEFQYSSKGRWCLYHILKSLNVKGPVLLPVYCCSTVLEPIKVLGLEYYFYDIRQEDMNAHLDSIKELSDRYHPECIIAVSMYGNPCCLSELEFFCKEKQIYLVDDAAQSVGSIKDGRRVGTFGDAGFFALSPGKPLAGHMGGFFWSSKNYQINYKTHTLLHKVIYRDFKLNRLNGLKYSKSIIAKFYKKASTLLQRSVDIKYDGYSSFENEIVGGIIHDSITRHTSMRTALAVELYKEVEKNQLFRFILPFDSEQTKGIAHKYIVVCESKNVADRLLDFVKAEGIRAQKGYKMLTDDFAYLPNAKKMDGRIVEVPLDPNREACNYIASVLNDFIKNNDIK